jgi:hypothetical protein
MANPHCWFRRPAEEHSRDIPAEVGNLSRELPSIGLGIPVPQAMVRDEEREREEEEYNMALALSLSANEVDKSDLVESQEQAQLARATQDSMTPATSSGAAESLSWSLFTENR